MFWWGDSISSMNANYCDAPPCGVREGRGKPLPVDSFGPNPWGLYNTQGNVTEWTADCWNESNAGNPGNGAPRETGKCNERVGRGGSWHFNSAYLEADNRFAHRAKDRLDYVGLRVARTLN